MFVTILWVDLPPLDAWELVTMDRSRAMGRTLAAGWVRRLFVKIARLRAGLEQLSCGADELRRMGNTRWARLHPWGYSCP